MAMCCSLLFMSGCNGLDQLGDLNGDGLGNSGNSSGSGYKVSMIDVLYDETGSQVREQYYFGYDDQERLNSYTIVKYEEDASGVTERFDYNFNFSSGNTMSLDANDEYIVYYSTNNHYYPNQKQKYTDRADNIVLNESGYVSNIPAISSFMIEMEEKNYAYSDGYLTSIECPADSYQSYQMTWENGNLVKYHTAESDNYPGVDVNFTYTDYPAPELGFFFPLALIPGDALEYNYDPFVLLYGKSPANMPSSVTISDSEYRIDITYDFSDGRVNSMVCKMHYENSDEYTFTMNFHYDDQDPDLLKWNPVLQSQKLVSDENISESHENGESIVTKRITWQNIYDDGSVTEDSMEFGIELGISNLDVQMENNSYYFVFESLSYVYNPEVDIKKNSTYTDGDMCMVPFDIRYDMDISNGEKESIVFSGNMVLNFDLSYIVNGNSTGFKPAVSFKGQNGYEPYDFMEPDSMIDMDDVEFSINYQNMDVQRMDGSVVMFSQQFEAAVTGTDFSSQFVILASKI